MTIFMYTHEWITGVSPHTGEPKTQTRRLVKTNEVLWSGEGFDIPVPPFVERSSDASGNGMGRIQYMVGITYAIQPGRGKHAVGRYQITDIRRQDVRDISDADVRAEGFATRLDFLQTWVRMHDNDVFFCHPFAHDGNNYLRDERGEPLPEAYWHLHVHGVPEGKRRSTLLHVNKFASDEDVEEVLRTRPDDRYQAWVLEIKLVASAEVTR